MTLPPGLTSSQRLWQATRALPEAVALLRNSAPREFSFSAAAMVLSGLTPALIGLITKWLVEELVASHGLHARLWWLVGAQLVLVLATGALMHAADYWRVVLRDRLQQHIRVKVAAHAAELDLAFFEMPGNFDMFSKAKRDLGFRPFLMAYALIFGLQQLSTVAGFFIAVLTFQPLLALALLCAVLPTLFAAGRSGSEVYDAFDLTTSDGRRAAYIEELLADDLHAKELRLYDLAPRFLEQLQRYARRVMGGQWAAQRRKAWRAFGADTVASSVQYLALAFVVAQVVRQQASLGDFTLMIAALAAVRQGLSQLLAQVGDLYENSLFFQDLSRFLAEKPKIVAPLGKRNCPHTVVHGLRFEDVSFAYPGAERAVFDRFSLDLPAGQTTAVVGMNGSGKTTLVKLLARLYDPTAGRITLDGVDIREFDPHEYRRLLGVVLQDFARYQLSARENVLLGRPGDENGPALDQALRASGAGGVFSRLPEGLDTLLGRQFHVRGQDLSGGQWQRVALARALYRDAPILLLDEPTAALDAEAEADLFTKYQDLSHGRTTLLITHRFNTVRTAHRIVVLEHGQVTEDGTHDALLALQGRYAQMFQAQAKVYA